MANQIVISRIQNRRGIKENLPQPLLPGEFALTIDTGELWIGTDPAQPPWGVRTYGSGAGDRTAAENIVDTEIVSAKFTTMDATSFAALQAFLVASVNVNLLDTDILYDDVLTVFVSADTSVDALNTVQAVVDEIFASPAGAGNYPDGAFAGGAPYRTLGAINDQAVDPTASTPYPFTTDGDFLFTIAGSNAKQGSNAASLINQIHGAQLVTTLSNLQVTTSGIGVGSSVFRDMTITDTDTGFTWLDTGTASANSVVDELTWVSGEGIDIQVDTTPGANAIRITNTIDSVAATPFTLTLSTGPEIVTGLRFDMEAPGTEISDVIILEYSLNIGGASAGDNNLTIIGTMHIVGNILAEGGLATLSDSQVEVRDTALVGGGVTFDAIFSPGTGTGGADEIQIHYTNAFTSDVSMRVLKRRWSSF